MPWNEIIVLCLCFMNIAEFLCMHFSLCVCVYVSALPDVRCSIDNCGEYLTFSTLCIGQFRQCEKLMECFQRIAGDVFFLNTKFSEQIRNSQKMTFWSMYFRPFEFERAKIRQRIFALHITYIMFLMLSLLSSDSYVPFLFTHTASRQFALYITWRNTFHNNCGTLVQTSANIYI